MSDEKKYPLDSDELGEVILKAIMGIPMMLGFLAFGLLMLGGVIALLLFAAWEISRLF